MERVSSRGLPWLVALLVGVAGCGGSDLQTTGLPIEDDFSGSCEWAEDDTEDVLLTCEGGEFRVLLKRIDQTGSHIIPRRLDAPVSGANIGADATLAAFSGDENDLELHGIACFADESTGPAKAYLFVVGTDAYAILKLDQSDESLAGQGYVRAFADSNSEVVAGVAKVNHIRGECRARGGRVELAMLVNGRKVATATDSNGFDSFTAFGFIAVSSVPGTEVRFDNFTASESPRD